MPSKDKWQIILPTHKEPKTSIHKEVINTIK